MEEKMACKTRKCNSPKKSGAKKRTKIVSTEFKLFAPEAEKVFIAGDFNNWDPEKYPMRKLKSGICKKKIKLKPGCYEYLFIVDGKWQKDPENELSRPNPFGGENSVIVITDDVIQEA